MIRTLRDRLSNFGPARAAYERLYAPLYLHIHSLPLVRNRLAPYMARLPSSFLWTPTGTGLDQRSELRRLARQELLEGASVLILGVGGGDEILDYWVGTKAASVTALDVEEDIDWKPSLGWPAVRSTAARGGLSVSFVVADGTTLPFANNSFDILYSRSVLEHVRDLDQFFAEAHRVLKPGGLFYSLFGPLWFTCDGPHVGIGYDHLLLSREGFIERVRQVGLPWQVRFVEQDLFSHLKLQDYLNLFDRYFSVERVAIAGSPEGERFKCEQPDIWRTMTKEVDEVDLLTRLVSVFATRSKE